jgi:nucleotide-binding universal stress UspA family protein
MQFRRIVIGIDFSEASLAGVRWVANHFAPEAELVLVHVVNEPSAPSYLRTQLPETLDLLSASARGLYGALHGVRDLVGAERARISLLSGAPVDILTTIADEVEADLICVGRGHRRRGSARFGATTPQRLVAKSRLPVLVTPKRPLVPPARVLAAIDERPGGDAVLRTAVGLAAAYEAHVDAFHVIEPEIQDYARAASRALMRSRGGSLPTSRLHLVTDDALDDMRLSVLARDWVSERLDSALAPPGRSVAIVRLGDPGEEIVAHAQNGGADLVVLGRGGDAARGGSAPDARDASESGAFRCGSTARLLLWVAPCPVLVMPLQHVGSEPPERPRTLKRYRPSDITSIAGSARGRTSGDAVPPAARRRRSDGNDAA